MAIIYNENSREFHLHNGKISYLIQIMRNGQLGHLYFGKGLKERDSFGHFQQYAYRDMAPCAFADDYTFSLEHLMQEYPAYASADSRYAAYDLEEENGCHVNKFVYKNHKIYGGKPELSGLPHTYIEKEEEAETLEILLEDEMVGAQIILTYTIYADLPVIARNARFICTGEQPVTLHQAMSLSLDLPDKDYVMLDLAGSWGRERHIHERPLDVGVQSIHSMRGHSSHQFNPFVALRRPHTTEHCGEVIGASFIYSGDFLAQVEVDNFDVTRLTMGIHPSGFDWKLKKGEAFQTPEAVLVYSEEGLNGMSQTFHTLFRTRLARGVWRDKERPILINNWEATYLDFNEEKILNLAKDAKELGIELLVLDDGWFGVRNDVKSSLGDWYPNLEKLPSGIKGLSEKVTDMGLKFGLWIEPEMVSPNSDLYRAHPDWILANVKKENSLGRFQYVLDLSKKEVVDYVYGLLEKILKESKISYIKWDMNRSLSESYSNGKPAEEQGKVRHQHVLGIYDLYERLTSNFPEILFESCASGGGRFDPGMLYYSPQGWISDDTDAVERLKIQYGTSMVYPISSMGSHVSAVPNHQVFRKTSLETRGNVAYFGTFGYELDLNALSEEEKSEIKEQIKFMKEYRSLIQKGTFYRLASPFEGNITAWMVVNEAKTEAILGYYRVLQPVNTGFVSIKLQGLDEEKLYRIEEENFAGYGDEWMQRGFSVSDQASGVMGRYAKTQGDYFSKVYHIVAE